MFISVYGCADYDDNIVICYIDLSPVFLITLMLVIEIFINYTHYVFFNTIDIKMIVAININLILILNHLLSAIFAFDIIVNDIPIDCFYN